MDKCDPRKPEKPYTEPTLVVYGTVQELTKSRGGMATAMAV
jgi:hypothetical protein